MHGRRSCRGRIVHGMEGTMRRRGTVLLGWHSEGRAGHVGGLVGEGWGSRDGGDGWRGRNRWVEDLFGDRSLTKNVSMVSVHSQHSQFPVLPLFR